MPCNLRLASEFNDGSLHDRRRLAVAQCLHDIYELMKDAPKFPTEQQRKDVAILSVNLMGCYRALGQEAMSSGLQMWKMKPKFHQSQHILEYQFFINPREVWLYADEDLQRIVKLFALSCHPSTRAFMVLYKWTVYTFFDCCRGLDLTAA